MKYLPPTTDTAAYFNYAFNYTDHLGNIRLSYGMDKEKGRLYILEENHYYPFGMKHEKYNSDRFEYVQIDSGGQYPVGIEPISPQARKSYQYKYNGKEWQDELGLNLYDYGWRQYDAAIGRWTTPDPLINDLKFTFDDSKTDNDDDDEIYQSIITKLDTGGGIYNPDNLNPYSYGYNNPVSFDDPDGRCPICPIIALAVMLLSSEPAMAPTKDKKGDEQKMAEAKQAKVEWMSNAVPGAGLRNGTAGTIVGAAVKSEIKSKVKEQVKKTAENVTSKTARREVMRKEGIPTSQQPKSQSKNSSGREYTYQTPKKGGGTETKSVQQQTKDRSHIDQPHWEAGKVKTNSDGSIRMNDYGRPKLSNQKSKVDYSN